MQWCFVSEMKPRYCVLFRKPAVRAVADAVLACRYSCILCSGYFIKSGCIPPLRIIPAQKFLQIRMHFPAENHPRAEISSNQDAFLLQKASLFGKIRRQGLFSRGECIPIRRNSSPGIIFPRRIHPYSKEFAARDYFPETNASLFGKIRCQGLFSRGESIPIRKNSLSGIIFPRRMHPYSEKFVARDYCSMENASLTSYFVESGCIPPGSQ